MNPRSQPRISISWLTLALSTLVFGVGFFISFEQDRSRAKETGELAWRHLSYALDLKDDLAVIDWSKNLEGMGTVSAFQAKVGPKIVTDGGNREFLPAATHRAISYKPPAQWTFTRSSAKDPQNPRNFILVLRLFPGPFFWGGFGFAVSFLAWVAASRLYVPRIRAAEATTEAPFSQPSLQAPVPAAPALAVMEGGRPCLFLDQQYVIQRINSEAAGLLEKNSTELLGGHLFDLHPDPRLMQAIEKKLEVKLLIPFISHPHLSASLKSDPHGTLLFLEVMAEAKPPQKH